MSSMLLLNCVLFVVTVFTGYVAAQPARVCVTKTDNAAIKASVKATALSKPAAVSGSGECVANCKDACKTVVYQEAVKLCTQYGRNFEDKDLNIGSESSTVIQIRPDSVCPGGGRYSKQKAQKVANVGGSSSVAKSALPVVYGGGEQPGSYGKPPAPEWNPWKPWSPCSASCGAGTQERSRSCNGYGCVGKDRETTICEGPPCCQEWTKWGACSSQCGQGNQERTRKCGGGYGGGAANVEKESQSCTSGQVPAYGSWKQQGSCSVTCGTGEIKHTRDCNTYGTPAYGSKACQCDGPSEKMEACQMPACCSEWTKWSECSNPCGSGEQTRTRKCGGGGKYGAANVETDTKSCSGGPAPSYGSWKQQGSCTVTCGTGQIKHTRDCSTYGTPAYGSKACQCDGSAEKMEACQMPACCTEWTKWGGCSNPCGPGEQTRTRKCGGGGSYGAANVETDKKSCNGGPSPSYGSWQQQGSCTVTCGTGQIKHTRDCNTYGTPAYGSKACQCDGPAEKTEACQMPACCTEWTKWGGCSNPCGPGKQTRTRKCGGGGSYGAANVETDTQTCQGAPTPTYGPWQPQGSCSVSCGKGTITHQRQCSGSGAGAGSYNQCPCEGPSTKTEPCNDGPCPPTGYVAPENKEFYANRNQGKK